jgi:ketosteroid isomerase-like protein
MATVAPTATAAVAEELADLCRAGKNLDAINKLYSPSIVSIEPVSGPDMPAETRGIDAIRKKNELWFETNDIHSVDADGPFVGHGDEFAMHYTWDVTPKQTGARMKISEMALYTVQDGKIAREQFFYHMPGK